MTFLKFLMVVALFSAVLAQESWAQSKSSKVPLICGAIISVFGNESAPASSYAVFRASIEKDMKPLPLFYDHDEKHIQQVYKSMVEDYGGITEAVMESEKYNVAMEACKDKIVKEKDGLYERLVKLDSSSSPDNFAKAVTGEDSTQKATLKPVVKREGGTCVGAIPEECSDEVPLVLNLDNGLSDWTNYETRRFGIVPENPQVVAYDDADCQCHQNNLNLANKSTETMGPAIDQELLKLKEIILKESAKKFVNNYAAVSEDMIYVASAESKFLRYKGGEKISEEEKRCVDPSGFQKAVDELCAKNGTTEGSKDRMSGILSILDPKLKGLPFDKALEAMNGDIGVLELPPAALQPGQNSKLNRSTYDQARRTGYTSDSTPQVKYANSMMTGLLSDNKIKSEILKKLNDGQEPLSVILDVMTDPHNDKLMNNILKNMSESYQYFRKSEIFAQMKSLKDKQLEQKSEANPFKDELTVLFQQAFKVSPTFKNLLMDGDLFATMTSKFSKQNPNHTKNGLHGIVTYNQVEFMKSMAKRCEKVQQEFAQNVCAKTDDVLDNVSTGDMLTLLSTKAKYDKSPDKDVVNMALCRFAKNQQNKNSAFNDVVVDLGNPFMKSDYFNRKIDPLAQQNSYFDVAKALLDKNNRDSLQRVVNYTASQTSSISKFQSSSDKDSDQLFSIKPATRNDSGVSSLIGNNHQVVSETTPAPMVSRDIASVSGSDVAKTIMAPVALSTPSNYVPVVPTVAATHSQEEIKNAENLDRASRDRLAKELSNSENKTRLKDHINSVDEKDAEEIFRLRDQAMKDRQIISDLRLQQERDKTEALRGEYEQLKARFDNLEKAEAAPVVAKTMTSTGGTSTAGSAPHFESATLTAPVAAGGSTGGRASGMNTPSSSSVGGVATLGDSINGSSNAAGAGSSVSATPITNGSSDSRGLSLTVTQSVGADGKIQSVEDPNRALINYLSKNDPSVQQLQELKTSGLVLTEEDVSKDGQKVQTKKMIKFNELSPEAKNLVEKKLAQVKLLEVKRNYSRQALILELFTASSKKSNLNVKKTGSLNF